MFHHSNNNDVLDYEDYPINTVVSDTEDSSNKADSNYKAEVTKRYNYVGDDVVDGYKRQRGEDDDGKTNEGGTVVHREPYELRSITNTNAPRKVEITFEEDEGNGTIKDKDKTRRSRPKQAAKYNKRGTSSTVKRRSRAKSNKHNNDDELDDIQTKHPSHLRDMQRTRRKHHKHDEDSLSSNSIPTNISGRDGDDIQPIQINEDITFSDIGGLASFIDKLKEMIYIPLLYPDFYTGFNTTPPRGVLFCGPPGTGKTLVARALACCGSKVAGQKVSFYMRKGADLLSKWVGESERQLKLLFEVAQKNQPSIIFFDEIDGIAPVRSSKLDQTYNSIVSTLLALMDGLDSRGQVILIGATNRIDSIDLALRRPGRFDREFNFPLPDCKARAEILNIHTRKWKHPPSEDFKRELASICVGFCGADLKALCTEAAIIAFREKYPEVYMSDGNILVDVDSIVVKKCHFIQAKSTITPASHRGTLSHSRPLSLVVEPCLKRHLDKVMENISNIFPFLEPYKTRTSSFAEVPFMYKPQFLLCGSEGVGLEHLGPAILHKLENFPVYYLDFCSLESNQNGLSLEQSLVNKFAEARKSAPCVLYLPRFHCWWEFAELKTRATLVSLFEDLPSDSPILLLGTSFVSPDDLDGKCSPLFPLYSVYEVEKPSSEDRTAFFAKMIEDVFSIQSADGKGQNSEKNGEALKPDSFLQMSTTSKVISKETERLGSQKESNPNGNHNHNVKRRKKKYGSRRKLMDRLEEIRKGYVEQTEGYDIARLEKLYTDLMKSSIDHITKDHGREEDLDRLVVKRKDILEFLHRFIPQNAQ